MIGDWQAWAAPVVVALAAILLVRSAWRHRHDHGGGCGCPGAVAGREWRQVQRQMRKARRVRRRAAPGA